jgi:hypothetical protein
VYVREPATTEMIWNTVRFYGIYNGERGQVIHARIKGDCIPDDINFEPFEVEFSDKTRNITGVVKVYEFTESAILSAYDAGGYEWCENFELVEPTV